MQTAHIIPIQSTTELPSLEQLCQEWRSAKKTEEDAKERRAAIEQQMIDLSGFSKMEGSQTLKTDDGHYKITLTAKLNRKLDTQRWAQIEPNIPENLRPVEQVITYKVIDKGIRYLENNKPEVFKQIAPCLTTTPAKTSIKVEVL